MNESKYGLQCIAAALLSTLVAVTPAEAASTPAPEEKICAGPFAGGGRPTFEALDRILTAHLEWLKAGRPNGDARRANLCGADLTDLPVALGPGNATSPAEKAADKIIAEMLGAPDAAAPRPAWSHPPDLSYANLRYVDLSKAELSGLKLIGADLTGAKLSGARAEYADLSAALLDSANLDDARFNVAKLPRARFVQASVRRTNFEEADLTNVAFGGVDLSSVSMAAAVLHGSTLCTKNAKRRFSGASLMGARLTSAELDSCDFTGAQLWGADFSDSWLRNVLFVDAELRRTNFKGSLWESVNLSGADFRGANLEDVYYDHVADGAPDVESIRQAENLQGLLYLESPLRLLELRDRFHAAGMRKQERMINYAANRSRRLHEQNWIESAFNYTLFELPVGYGLYPGRPLQVIGLLIPFFAVVYFFAVRFPGKDGVWREWNPQRVRKDIGSDAPERLLRGTLTSIGLAFYFSILSAFHIGWRDLNIGSWIARIQPHDYVLRGSGWVRAVSGVQSLLSVYLLALWLVSYFGRPFLA